MIVLWSHKRRALTIFGGWTLFALFFTCQAYISNAYFGRPLIFIPLLISWLTCAYLWALLTPPVLKLAQRFPLEQGKLPGRCLIHLATGAVVSFIQLASYSFLHQWLFSGFSPSLSAWRTLQNLIVVQFQANLLIYWAVIGLCQAQDYYRRFRERERRAATLEVAAAQLETQLARAQLDALKMQLHPHFLFNTLNSISVLMRDDPTAANRMLVRLSELLRATLKSDGKQEVSLRQELEFLRGYLEIEQTRLQDRLTVEFDIENESLDAQVPNLILQPLVENAIRHGVAPLASAGLIQINARCENGFINLRVSDNGAGLAEAGMSSKGIGLANTRKRLEKLYGEAYEFEITSALGGGVQVNLRIPFHTNHEGK